MIAHGEISGVLTYEIDEGVIFPSQVQPDGDVDLGVFANKAKLIVQTGAPGQQALTSFFAPTDFGEDARGTDIAWLAGRFVFEPDVFLGGVPKVAVIVKGSVVLDPRTGITAWHHNPALVLYDYLSRQRVRLGLGLSGMEFDLEAVKDAADICDQIVAVKQTSAKATPTASTFASIVMAVPTTPFQTGDRVQLSTGAGEVLPSGLATSTDYYVVVVHDRTNDAQLSEISLASSYANAIASTTIANGNLTTEFTITKTGEPRYTISATFEDREDKGPIIEEMLKAMAGRLLNRDGRICIVAGAVTTPVLDITIDEINTGIEVEPKLDPRSRVNTVLGTYRSPLNRYRATDYPPISSSTFIALDGGEQLLGRLDLPFVPRSGQAQRLAAIFLGQLRQELRASFSGDLRLYKPRAGDRVRVTVPSLGWTLRDFLVIGRVLSLGQAADGITFNVDLQLEATSDTVFDFDPETQETKAAPPPISAVPDPRTVSQPGSPQFTEDLLVTTDGAGVRNRLTVTWEGSSDAFVVSYRLQYRVVGDTRFVEFNELRDTQLIVDDLAPATYEFQIQARNSFNVLSPVTIGNFQVRGLIDVPTSLTNFDGQIVGITVFLQWDTSPDLDVRVGGQIEIRHHPDESVGMSAESLLVTRIGGERAADQVPFKRGTYYIRAVDQGGRAGPFSAWSTEGVAPVQRISVVAGGAFTGTDGIEDEATIDEGAALFPSTNPLNTGVVINAQDELELDVVGGLVVTSGIYFFSTSIGFDSNVKIVIETLLRASIVDLNDVWDDRTGTVDGFASWDSLATTGKAEAEIQARTKRLGGTFGDWVRVDTKIVFASDVEFRIVLDSQSTSAQIRIDQAKVFIQEVEYQRLSQAGVRFVSHRGRMPLLTGSAVVEGSVVVHAGTMPLLEGAAAISDADEAALKAGGLSTSLAWFVGSHPPGDADLGDDTAGNNAGTVTGATLDALHPTQGWYGIRQDAFNDRVSYSAADLEAAVGSNLTTWSAAVFATVEDLENFGLFYCAPWDDDAHTSPFFNALFGTASLSPDRDQRYYYFTTGTSTDFWATIDLTVIIDDNLPHWYAVVCDTTTDDAIFYLDGIEVATVNTGNAPRNWNQAAGLGNTIVIGTRNDVAAGEGMKGLGHQYAEWPGRKLSAAEVLELCEDPTTMLEVTRDPRRPVVGNVSNGGQRLSSPVATNDFTFNHTAASGANIYVFVFVTSDEAVADTPTVTVKFEISSIESGTVTEITDNSSGDLVTEGGLPTCRAFRIVAPTSGAGVITVDVSFGGSGTYRIGGAAAVNISDDGGPGYVRTSQPADSTVNGSDNDYQTLVNTPLSRVFRYNAVRGGSRTFTNDANADRFQRDHFDEQIAGGLSFETRHLLQSMARPIGGYVPQDISWTGGGADHCAISVEILPSGFFNQPVIREFVTGTATQASGQTDQVVVNLEHRDTTDRALLVLVSTTNDDAGVDAPTVTAKWEISAVESGTVNDLSIAALDDAAGGVPSVHAFLIKGATAGSGSITVDVDMGSGNVTRSVAVSAFDLDGVSAGGATGSARDTSAVTEQEFSITPESDESLIFILSAMQDDDHVLSNAGLTIAGPHLVDQNTGTALQDHTQAVTFRSNRLAAAQDVRTRWTLADKAASFALEIKPA